MLYIFAGDDSKKKYKAYEEFMESASKQADIFFINRNNFDKFQIENLFSGAGLFFENSPVFFENILDREEEADFILSKLDFMKDSGRDFVFLEGALRKPTIDAFKKARAEINVFELPKEKKEKFDNFLLANAFGVRDKLGLWIYFRQAVDLGVGLEELVGVLFWKAKDMILKRNFIKWKPEELENFASKIAYLIPEARKEGKDAETLFEKFLLESL